MCVPARAYLNVCVFVCVCVCVCACARTRARACVYSTLSPSLCACKCTSNCTRCDYVLGVSQMFRLVIIPAFVLSPNSRLYIPYDISWIVL